MNPNIKNIIFDWGGVLIDVTMKRFVTTCKEYGISFDDGEISSTHKAGFFQEYELGNISTEDLRNELRKRASKDLSDQDIDYIWNTMIEDVPKDKLQLLESLRTRYNVYLLSNTNALHWESASDAVFCFNGLGKNDFFKKIFLSYEMHLAKPDTEIFTCMLKEAGLKPEETLFVDDSMTNCKAAESVGINVAHYTPGESLQEIFK